MYILHILLLVTIQYTQLSQNSPTGKPINQPFGNASYHLWWFMVIYGGCLLFYHGFTMVLPWFHPHQRGISHGLPWPLPYPARTWRRSWHVWWRSSIRRWRRRTKSWPRRSAASGSWTWRRGQERRRNNILNWVYLDTHNYTYISYMHVLYVIV